MGLNERRNIYTNARVWILPVVYAIFTFGNHFQKLQFNDANTLPTTNASGTRQLLQLQEIDGVQCIPAAIQDFPADFMTQADRLQGGIVFHILISCYMCYALAIVCDDYFIPSLEGISQALDLSSDVAGATFMAAGTSAPELFTSVVGAFITEGDIGVGTIVGSAVFNILAVVSVCGLLAGSIVPLDWWPLSRDCIAYTITVIMLIIILQDEEVYWYEALILLVCFFLYILTMYFNEKLSDIAHNVIDGASNCCRKEADEEKAPLLPPHHEHRIRTYSALSGSEHSHHSHTHEHGRTKSDSESKGMDHQEEVKQQSIVVEDDEQRTKDGVEKSKCSSATEEEETSLWRMPKSNSCSQIMWVIIWPVSLLFYITIPDCRKETWKKWFPCTFLVAVTYIGLLSYLLSWMVTIIGYTFNIPDTVMGLTFLAAGTSVPEAISSVIVCRQGFGNMAISNSVGSNVFDILFCLGLPWFIKSLINSSVGHSVHINSKGIEYSVLALLLTVVVMFGSVAINKFRLDKKVGVCCLIMYATFLVVSSLFELNIFGVFNLPACPHE